MLKFIGCMMQLIISPGKGWVDVAAVGESPQQLATSGFYPLLGITACSAFLPRIYDNNLTLPVLIESAVVTFVSYFIAYFLASALMSATIGKVSTDNPGDKKINTFILYNLSILALITLIRNCLPMELSLVQFMPLFVLVIMWAGRQYLNIAEGNIPSFLLLCALFILLPPYVVGYVFKLLMPI